MSIKSFLLRIPKAEVHIHFEARIRPVTLIWLAVKNDVQLPADDEHGVRRWLRVRDIDHFGEVYRTCCRCLRDPEDFHLAALDVLAEQAVQNILYSEVHFDISTHRANGADIDAVRQAQNASATASGPLKMRLCSANASS